MVTEIKVERITIPQALLTCAPAPAVPAAPVTQRALAHYVVDLAAAGADCRDKLTRVRAWSEGD